LNLIKKSGELSFELNGKKTGNVVKDIPRPVAFSVSSYGTSYLKLK
jgi:hypothetical protein